MIGTQRKVQMISVNSNTNRPASVDVNGSNMTPPQQPEEVNLECDYENNSNNSTPYNEETSNDATEEHKSDLSRSKRLRTFEMDLTDNSTIEFDDANSPLDCASVSSVETENTNSSGTSATKKRKQSNPKKYVINEDQSGGGEIAVEANGNNKSDITTITAEIEDEDSDSVEIIEDAS